PPVRLAIDELGGPAGGRTARAGRRPDLRWPAHLGARGSGGTPDSRAVRARNTRRRHRGCWFQRRARTHRRVGARGRVDGPAFRRPMVNSIAAIGIWPKDRSTYWR